jgi:hypothetical protein
LIGGHKTIARGAIVFSGNENGNNWFSPLAIEMDIEVESAFPVETIALIAGCESAIELGKIRVNSDCKGAIAAVNKKNRDINRMVANWNPPTNVEINKVKAHPERRGGEWSLDDEGIYLADMVAGKIITNIPIIKASEVVDETARKGLVTIVDTKGIPFIGNLRRRMSTMRLKKYLEKRDGYRENRGKRPIWAGANLGLSQGMMGKSGTMEDRSAVLRINLGKRWATSWINSDICRACGTHDRSMHHTLRKCKNKGMVEARKIWMSEVSKCIYKIKDRDLRGGIEDMWAKMKYKGGGEFAMCGCFQTRFVETLYKGNMELRDGEDRTITNVLRKIGEGSREMIKIYMESYKETGIAKELRQTNMIGYYGKKGKGIETRKVVTRAKKTKKKKKNTGDIVGEKKGGYREILVEDNIMYWEFKRG